MLKKMEAERDDLEAVRRKAEAALADRVSKVSSLLEVRQSCVVVLLNHIAAFEVDLAEKGHGNSVPGFGGLSEVIHGLAMVHLNFKNHLIQR